MTYTAAQYAVGEASEKVGRDGSPKASEGRKDVGSLWWGHARSGCTGLLALVCSALLLSPYSLLVVEAVGFWDTPTVYYEFSLAGWEEGASRMSVALVVGIPPKLWNL